MRCSGRGSRTCRRRYRHHRVRPIRDGEGAVRNTRLYAVVLLTLLLLALGSIRGLEAHDMWIEPTSFSVDLGRVLGVKLRVGDNFHGDPIPRTEAMIDRFVVADANGTREVVGREGADPAG